LDAHAWHRAQAAEVVAVEAVEGSDKLWKCQVDVGDVQPRQIVAGLQQHIPLDTMQGMSAVAICNLKAAKLGGQLSEGMLLAASNEDKSVVKTLRPPEGSAPGDPVRSQDLLAPASCSPCQHAVVQVLKATQAVHALSVKWCLSALIRMEAPALVVCSFCSQLPAHPVCHGLQAGHQRLQVFCEGGAAHNNVPKTLKTKVRQDVVHKLRVSGGKPSFDGKPLCTASGVCSLSDSMPDGSTIS
jgi:methionine--tRNA ligase beta chain